MRSVIAQGIYGVEWYVCCRCGRCSVLIHPGWTGGLIPSGVPVLATFKLTACAHAGAEHGQELPPERMEALIRAAGRQPRQRTTLYSEPPVSQVAASYNARPLVAV